MTSKCVISAGKFGLWVKFYIAVKWQATMAGEHSGVLRLKC